jgi:hypothetical protein
MRKTVVRRSVLKIEDCQLEKEKDITGLEKHSQIALGNLDRNTTRNIHGYTIFHSQVHTNKHRRPDNKHHREI